MLDVIKLVKEKQAKFSYSTIISEYQGYKLYIKVFQDAMKFNEVPRLDWHRVAISHSKTYNGVRLPASAEEIQQVADLTGCMMLTPKVIEKIWEQATLRFPAIYNVDGNIVAITDITRLHQKIEEKTKDARPDDLISCVGKYWCLINRLAYAANDSALRYKENTACNYGWFDPGGAYIGFGGHRQWQPAGFKHDNGHFDPSQTIRLMYRKATLVNPDNSKEEVDLHDIAKNPKLAWLIHHEGELKYLRQFGVPELDKIEFYNLENHMEFKPNTKNKVPGFFTRFLSSFKN